MRLLGFIIDTLRHVAGAIDGAIDAIQVESIGRKLDERAAQSDAKNWRVSVVDLMKLAGLDSSLPSRRELARELGYQANFQGSADDNAWLRSRLHEALAERDIHLPRGA